MMALGLCRTHAIAAIAGATVDSKRWHLHSHTNLVSKTASDSLLLAYMQLLDSNYAIRTLQPYIVLYCHTLTKTVFLDGWMEDGICGPCFSVKLTSSPAPTHGKPSLRFHFISLPFYWAFVFSLLQQINTGLKGFPIAPDSDGVLPQPPTRYSQKKKKKLY